MDTATRAGNSELSSIDTALLIAGILDARQFFSSADVVETEIRARAIAISERVDWTWMARGTNAIAMGWFPSGFIAADWIGYNEAMILYILGLAATEPLPASAWDRWTGGYEWQTLSNPPYVPFPPLFGHQYSHCWIDFRQVTDSYMNGKKITYFENSRRATLAQRAYAITNPRGFADYGSNVWGFTACDGPPPAGYTARGAPNGIDDGTIAPTEAMRLGWRMGGGSSASRILNSRRLKLAQHPSVAAARDRLTIPEFAPTEAR